MNEHVAFTELSTPLTYEHYTNHISGAAYGIASTINRPNDMRLHPVSGIKNLYYTGADILSHGILGAFIGGIFTASIVCTANLVDEFGK